MDTMGKRSVCFIVGICLASVLFIGCGAGTATGGSATGGTGTSAGVTGTVVPIDWVNFVRFNGITYLEGTIQNGRNLTEGDLGSVFAQVRFKLEENVHDANYHAKDGDAAYLPAGTPVYTVKGYQPTYRLAAHQDGNIVMFEVSSNPQAHTGADIFDIGGKVEMITVNSEQDGTTPLATIKDPQQVATLVAQLLHAPVQPDTAPAAGTRYFLAFHLHDGTVTTHPYWLESNELSPGMLQLPASFQSTIKHALGK